MNLAHDDGEWRNENETPVPHPLRFFLWRGWETTKTSDQRMAAQKYPEGLEHAIQSGVLKRLPLTFLPFVNQQLHQWDYLFPNERRAVQHLLNYVAAMSEEQSAALFADVQALEDKMGIRHW